MHAALNKRTDKAWLGWGGLWWGGMDGEGGGGVAFSEDFALVWMTKHVNSIAKLQKISKYHLSLLFKFNLFFFTFYLDSIILSHISW